MDYFSVGRGSSCDSMECREPLTCSNDNTCECPANNEYDHFFELCIHEEGLPS